MSYQTPHPELAGVKCEISGNENHPECTGWSEAHGDYVDWPNPSHVPTKKITNGKARVQEMAARVIPAPRVVELEGFPAGEAGSQRAAGRWTDAQKVLVDNAIRAVAQDHRGGGEFTSDAIWDKLNGAVPVTKGLTSRLMVASRAGLIDKTGKTVISGRGGHHDHGQRLGVWYSLVPKA